MRTPLDHRTPLRRRQAIAMRPKPKPWWPRVLRVFRAVFVVTVPLGLAGWVAASPAFRNLDFEVTGVDRVPPEWVKGRLETLADSHLLTVGRKDLDALLLNHPWIESVAVAKRLPNQLRIDIEERRPVALWRHEGRLQYLDQEGYPIALYDATVGGLDLPMLGWEKDPPIPVVLAQELMAYLEAVDRSWSEKTSELELIGEDDVRVVTGALPFPLLLHRDSASRALVEFRRNLPQIERTFQEIALVDLRFEGRMVLRMRTIQKKMRYLDLPEGIY